jgi:hypothetical protein
MSDTRHICTIYRHKYETITRDMNRQRREREERERERRGGGERERERGRGGVRELGGE